MLKPLKLTKGYLGVNLYDENKKGKMFKIHRLVAEYFIQKEEGKEHINHIDGNKSNNKVENLEWCNPRENMQHSYKIGLRKKMVKPIEQYDMQGNFIKRWESIMQVERELKIPNTNISNCCRGKRKSVGGYIWRFA